MHVRTHTHTHTEKERGRRERGREGNVQGMCQIVSHSLQNSCCSIIAGYEGLSALWTISQSPWQHCVWKNPLVRSVFVKSVFKHCTCLKKTLRGTVIRGLCIAKIWWSHVHTKVNCMYKECIWTLLQSPHLILTVNTAMVTTHTKVVWTQLCYQESWEFELFMSEKLS